MVSAEMIKEKSLKYTDIEMTYFYIRYIRVFHVVKQAVHAMLY
jgi:hypothetical protein